MPDNGVILVVTDAGTHQRELEEAIKKKSKEKNIKIFIAFFPKCMAEKACSESMPSYKRVSEGRIFDQTDSKEFFKSVLNTVSRIFYTVGRIFYMFSRIFYTVGRILVSRIFYTISRILYTFSRIFCIFSKIFYTVNRIFHMFSRIFYTVRNYPQLDHTIPSLLLLLCAYQSPKIKITFTLDSSYKIWN